MNFQRISKLHCEADESFKLSSVSVVIIKVWNSGETGRKPVRKPFFQSPGTGMYKTVHFPFFSWIPGKPSTYRHSLGNFYAYRRKLTGKWSNTDQIPTILKIWWYLVFFTKFIVSFWWLSSNYFFYVEFELWYLVDCVELYHFGLYYWTLSFWFVLLNFVFVIW